ncbi:MAG: CopG family transcriptional regulator, partial [Candidatus Desantisbacteria bacterium]
MKRTQIYLLDDQWRYMNVVSKQEKKSIASLIRFAIDKIFIQERKADFTKALHNAAGIWADREDLQDTQGFIRGIRKDSRLQG